MQRSNDWLDIKLMEFHSYVKVCVTEKQYEDTLHSIQKKPMYCEDWLKEGGPMTAVLHSYLGDDNLYYYLVCLDHTADRTGIETAGLLVHEAYHLLESQFEHIGEKNMVSEIAAYYIQRISQELMEQYVNLTLGAIEIE